MGGGLGAKIKFIGNNEENEIKKNTLFIPGNLIQGFVLKTGLGLFFYSSKIKHSMH